MIPKERNKTFAENFSKHCDEWARQNGTYCELAEHLGIYRSTLSRFRSGESYPHKDTMKRICKAFNTTEAELLGEATKEYVCIEGMEMPTRCEDCPLQFVFPSRQTMVCMARGIGRVGEFKKNTRQEFCPLRIVQGNLVKNER